MYMYHNSREVLLMSPMVCALFYFQEAKKADLSLEDEWLSFEKMISDQPPGQTNSDSGSSQYLVQGMVAYPGMSSQLAPKQVSSAPEVEDSKHLDGNVYKYRLS